MNRSGTLKIFGGSSHPQLTKRIARKVGARVGELVLGKFENKETQVELKECVRGLDIYVVQTAGGANPNDNLMELLFLINALRLSAAAKIIVIIPFFFYSKGDQKDGDRVPITSKLVGALLKKAGATNLMMLDPHTPQVEGFFDLIVDTLRVEPLFCEWVRHHVAGWEHSVVISPDEGGAKRSVSLANDLMLDFAIISNRNKNLEKDSNHLGIHKKRKKKRSFCDSESVLTLKGSSRSSVVDPTEFSEMRISPKPNDIYPDSSPLNNCQLTKETQTELFDSLEKDNGRSSSRHVAHLSCSVNGRHVIIVDDMIDTGHTINIALKTTQRAGAISVTILVTHGVFSKGALRILESYGDFIKAVVVTNSISQTQRIEAGRLKNKLHVLDVSGLIAEFVRRHHYRESVSVLGRFMPIRDSDFGDGLRELDEKKKKEADIEIEIPEFKSEFENGGPGAKDDDPNEVFDIPGSNEDLITDSQSDQEESVEPEDVELARRQILDPSTQQRLRKGFRMASICWDD